MKYLAILAIVLTACAKTPSPEPIPKTESTKVNNVPLSLDWDDYDDGEYLEVIE